MRCRCCLLSMTVSLLLPLPAFSLCGAPQPRLVCAEYFASQLVVEATLVQTRTLHDKDDPEGISAWVYTLHVNRVLRGKIGETIQVNEGNDSGRASFDWVTGRQYLLFLFYVAGDNAWGLEGCGNSGPVSKAGMALSEIAAIKAAHGGGVIHGVVRIEALSVPLPGVHIEARGATGLFEAITDEKGTFQLSVPVGQYVVRAVKEGSAFEADILSYEKPQNIRIEPGGCAQIQFFQAESPAAQ